MLIGDAAGDGICSRAGTRVTCDYGQIAPGIFVRTVLRLTPQAAGTIAISAIAESDVEDAEPENNSAVLTRTVMEAKDSNTSSSGGGGGGAVDPLMLILMALSLAVARRRFRHQEGGTAKGRPGLVASTANRSIGVGAAGASA